MLYFFKGCKMDEKITLSPVSNTAPTPPQQNNELEQINANIKALANAHNELVKVIQGLQNNLNLIQHGYFRTTPQPYLGLVEFHLAENCNLNCKGCAHFSQLAAKELADPAVLERDFARLSEISEGLVGKIHLMGGEPLLHPELASIMTSARKHFPNTLIKLVTNGVLLPKMNDEFFATAAKNKILIAATPYPLEINWDKVNEKIAEFGCDFEWFDGGEPGKKTFRRFALDKEGKQNARLNFMRCGMANSCVLLRDGKLYPCSIIANIHHFNGYFGKKGELEKPMLPSKIDYIDIYKATSYEEILRFMAHPAPFCRFCKLDEWVETGTWTTSKREISEYL